MFSWLFKNKKPSAYPRIDMHSHLLPGIDDGAPDTPTALALIRAMRNLGYEHFIATPHIMKELHPNTPETIQTALTQLQTALNATEDLQGLRIQAAAEYMLDEGFEALVAQKHPLLCLSPQKHLLVELPQAGEPPHWEHLLFTLQTRGYKPILAHPERYRYLSGDFARFERLTDSGVLLQINLLSFAGYYGQGPEKMAHELLKRDMAELLGSDLHNHTHAQQLEAFLSHRQAQRVLDYDWRNEQLFAL